MKKEKLKRIARWITAFTAAAAMAATFTFPTELGEGIFYGFGNAIVASAEVVNRGTCGTSVNWSLDSDGTLTISGTGEMTNWGRSWDVPWCDFRDKIKSVVIKNGVTSIGDFAFSGCASLTSITIPNSVTSIGADAFFNCTSLASITIPNSVTSIGYAAFMQCESLASITIPNSVTSIGNGAFYFCKSLTSIAIPDRVTSIGDSAFGRCTSLASITIPKGVTSIGEYAFNYCTSLTSITIPDSVTSIGNDAFHDCTSLTSITIPDSVTSIGNYAFFNCQSLTSIAIPGSVTSIGEYAFYCCESLTSITIPGSVTSIGECAFCVCTSLTSITIPNSVTSIGNDAFNCCRNLTSITIPNSVTSIGADAFFDCTSLTSIFIPYSLNVSSAGIPETAAQVKYTVDTDGNVTITSVTLGSGQTSVTIPETIDGKAVTSIGNEAFKGCTSLTIIFLPNTVDVSNAGISASATQIKYTVESERTVINEVKLGTDQTDCLLPATLFEKPVYLAEASLETCPTVTHDHREKTAANCTEKPVCAICVKEYDEALGHDHSGDWQNDTADHWKICLRSGCNEIIDKEAHVIDNGTVTKEATPTENGTITYKCTVCGAKMGEETITAKISSFDVTSSGVVVKYTVTGSTAVKSQTLKFSEVTEEMVELMKSKDIKLVIDFVNYSTAGSDTIILTDAQIKAIEYVLEHDFSIAS